MKQTTLVTGATGLLGAHLLVELSGKGLQLRALHRKGSDLSKVKRIFSYYSSEPDQLFEGIDWVEADLLDVSALEAAFEGVNQVYHCAAIVSFAPQDSKRLLRDNPQTTANVVNLCLEMGVDKLVYVSSVAALGRQKQGDKIDENTEWVESKQNSAYAKSKYLAELEVWRGIAEGLKAVIVNPCIIWGPGPWDEGSVAMFGRINNGMKFYTLGVNAYVDARDVANAMRLLMESDLSAERYVLISENKSYKEAFDLIAKSLGVKAPGTRARVWMGEIVWRLEVLRSRLFGGTPLITKETARTAHQKNFYSAEKVKQAVEINFRPVEQSAREISEFFRADQP